MSQLLGYWKKKIKQGSTFVSALMLRCDILIICQPFHFTSAHFDTSDMVKHASSLSNTEGEIMALGETLHFLRGTIYSWQSTGTSRRPDSFRNGHVSFWPRLFMPVFYDWVLLLGLGKRAAWDWFNTDVVLMFSEMGRLTFWHCFCWFRLSSPASCQSKGGRSRRFHLGIWIVPDGQ